jgi:hypothetical protein
MKKKYSVLQNFIESLSSSQKDVLLFGDSVFLRVSTYDNDNRSLDLMIQERLPQLSVAVVKESAYAVDIFLEYLKLFKAEKLALIKPLVICIHLNLRCFSPQWKLYPPWEFRQEKKLLRKIQSGKNIDKYELRLFQFNFIKNILYKMRKVDYGLSQYNRIQDFTKIIKSHPIDPAKKIERLRTLFKFHYLYHLSDFDIQLGNLKSCVDVSSGICRKVFVYCTPVNYQAGVELLGDDFIQTILEITNKISMLIKKNEQQQKLLFCDYSMLLDRDCFFHSYDATEHLNEKGRNILAGHLADRINSSLSV